MFNFKAYLFEIFTVGHIQQVDVDVAFDKFRADVNAGTALEYNTGTALPDFDFAKAKVEWNALTPDEQKSAITDYNVFVCDNYEALCKVFGESKDAVRAFVGA